MRGLQSLIRVHRARLEAERRKLGEMEALAAGFASQIETLRERAGAEGRAAGAAPDAAHAIGGFVQAVVGRIRRLSGSLAEVEREMETIRARVRLAFQELKRYEIAEERRLARAREETRRRERIAEDELGLAMHRRGGGLRAG